MGRRILDACEMLRTVLLLATSFCLVNLLFENTAASVYGSPLFQPNVTIAIPSVILDNGTVGSQTIYANNTSAKVSVEAPVPTPTYYPNGYSIPTGTYVSGSVPSSVQTVDSNYFVVRSLPATSTTTYYPSGCGLLGNTTLVSGITGDLVSNNGIYMTFRSYASATSAQALYAHQETTTIGGQNYYFNKLTSADAVGTSLPVSMTSTGRKLMGQFVYSLAGVTSIPSSIWTVYYRAWQTAGAIAFDAVSSGSTDGGSSFSWSHTTGSGSNRIMIVGISIKTTTVSVSSITYGTQSLTFARADTHASATIRSELWYLIASNSGAHTVTVNLSGTSKATGGSCTYTGVDQTSPFDNSAGNTGTSNSPSQTVTVNTANAWLLGNLAISTSGVQVGSEGSGQNLRWDVVTGQGPGSGRNRGHGSDKGPVGIGGQAMSWTLLASGDWAVSLVALKSAFSAVGHADIDVLIRQPNGTIRQTIATDVAPSGNLGTTATTLSGTCSWTNYSVISQSDYLEIDYYTHVTTASSAVTAYLRIDDNTLSTADQTKANNISLPSEFMCEAEFTGTSNTESWAQLVWTVDSALTTSSVTVTIQVYNYTAGGYSTSGDGYDSYTSSPTANTDETRNQTIATNPTQFRDDSGNWKMRIKTVKTMIIQFDFEADWIEFKPTRSTQCTVSTEFLFSSTTTKTPTQLNFTVVSEYDLASINVTIQVWNYSSSDYVANGEGYLNYISSGSNETKLLNINTNPQSYASDGNAKIRVTGTKTTATQYQQETNQVKLTYNYSSSSTYDYILKIINQVSDVWNLTLKSYNSSNLSRLSSTMISFHDGTSSNQIIINNGNITQSEGSPYVLAGNATIYISMSTLQATNAGTSYLHVYLKILTPNTTTYLLYVITFEVT